MKYLKFKSVTWWASFVPLVIGVFKATVSLHGMTEWVAITDELTGHAPAYAMINAGLAGIGIRAAM